MYCTFFTFKLYLMYTYGLFVWIYKTYLQERLHQSWTDILSQLPRLNLFIPKLPCGCLISPIATSYIAFFLGQSWICWNCSNRQLITWHHVTAEWADLLYWHTATGRVTWLCFCYCFKAHRQMCICHDNTSHSWQTKHGPRTPVHR